MGAVQSGYVEATALPGDQRAAAVAGREWQADVDPWSIVVRHGRWYLLCWSHASDGRRAYRIDRMRNVAILDEPFEAPADLDPVKTLEEHLAVGWEFAVDIEVECPAEELAPRISRMLGSVEPNGPDRCRLVGSTGNPYWYAEQLAALPAEFRINGGPEVRACVRQLGQRLLAATATTAKDSGTQNI